MKIRVADYIAQHLASIGVRKVFLLSGGGMMHLLDAIARIPSIHYICHHHEQAAAMAAEGYARQSGNIGVCYVTSGPGAPNTLTGVIGAWLDSTPMLVVSGQAKLAQANSYRKINGLRQFGAYDVNSVSIMEPVTKYATMLTEARLVRYHLEKAIHLATTGRPGPVFIDVPLDIQGELIDPDTLEGYTPEIQKHPPLEQTVIDRILEKLQHAERPVILAGHGVRSACVSNIFDQVVQVLNVPVITTQMATDLMGHDDPLLVGRCGTKGDRAGNLAVQSADVILILGTSLHVTTTGYELGMFAPHAFKIQVELDAAVLEREQVGVQLKIHISLEEFLSLLLERMASRNTPLAVTGAWHERCQLWKHDLSVSNEPHKRPRDAINYYDLIDVLSDVSEPQDTVVSDAGTAWYLVSQAFRVKHGQRVILSGGLGTMGYAVPCATGASVAGAKRVLCVTGDGSLMTALHELAVIRANALNVKMIIANNNGYASIRNTQYAYFHGKLAGTGPESGIFFPDFGFLAKSFDIKYLRVSDLALLREALVEAISYDGPCLCEVVTPDNQEIIPTVSTVSHEDGRLESKPLDDMFPFMGESARQRYLSY
jgi:acetolactate synthase-1/2/3 large subunit